jgi:tripeptide aminopeptidase
MSTPLPRTVDTLADAVLARTIELCQVAAPPLDEADRAAVVTSWWTADQIQAIHSDAAGNVWGRLRTGPEGVGAAADTPALVVAAHLDTVFGRDVEHGVRREGDQLIGPGVGDDTVAVAALSALDRLLPADVPQPIWILATVGEEGLGNLKGVTAALASPPPRGRTARNTRVQIGALIAVEGNYLGRVNVVGVGSVRWRVTVTGPGGHAWEQAEHPSAVHEAIGILAALTAVERPAGERTALNVGVLNGGESINARARRCVFEVDLRAEAAEPLAELAAAVRAVLTVEPPLALEIQDLGFRPAGRLAPDHPLARAAADALRAEGIEPRFTAASTDANAAYARGIPAVTVGVTTGDGTHTEAEWIDMTPLASGLRALAATVSAGAHPRVDPPAVAGPTASANKE